MKTKHPKAWFINRIGKILIKNCAFDLFNPTIIIQSPAHAAALYISQKEKNFTYNELK